MNAITQAVAALVLMLAQFSQSNTGELRLLVSDPAGLPLQAGVALDAQANQVSERLATDERGQLTARRLPFGTYRVTVTLEGFAPSSTVVEIRSAG